VGGDDLAELFALFFVTIDDLQGRIVLAKDSKNLALRAFWLDVQDHRTAGPVARRSGLDGTFSRT
jgi:hypothetical protein